jgi:hypothetical protein
MQQSSKKAKKITEEGTKQEVTEIRQSPSRSLSGAAILIFHPDLVQMPRLGDRYELSAEQLRDFRELGLATLPDMLTEAEVAELEIIYDRFMR